MIQNFEPYFYFEVCSYNCEELSDHPGYLFGGKPLPKGYVKAPSDLNFDAAELGFYMHKNGKIVDCISAYIPLAHINSENIDEAVCDPIIKILAYWNSLQSSA